MGREMVCGCVLVVFVEAAAGQSGLYAVRGNGDVVLLNAQTGAGYLVGSSGVACDMGMAPRWSDGLLLAGGDADGRLTRVDRWTGRTSSVQTVTGLPAGYRISGLTLGGWALL